MQAVREQRHKGNQQQGREHDGNGQQVFFVAPVERAIDDFGAFLLVITDDTGASTDDGKD